MKTYLSGGGTVEDMHNVNLHFAENILYKKLLVIPQAAAPELVSFEFCEDFIGNISAFDHLLIEMEESLEEITSDIISRFGGIYFLGGMTSTLMHEIKTHRFDVLVDQFIKEGKPVCGMSAGAVIMGSNLATVENDPDEKRNNLIFEEIEQ